MGFVGLIGNKHLLTSNSVVPSGRRIRIRGIHVMPRGGAGAFHIHDHTSATDYFVSGYMTSGQAYDIAIPEPGLLFPTGASVSIPVSVNAIIFYDG